LVRNAVHGRARAWVVRPVVRFENYGMVVRTWRRSRPA
jgi:hypothetical protein